MQYRLPAASFCLNQVPLTEPLFPGPKGLGSADGWPARGGAQQREGGGNEYRNQQDGELVFQRQTDDWRLYHRQVVAEKHRQIETANFFTRWQCSKPNLHAVNLTGGKPRLLQRDLQSGLVTVLDSSSLAVARQEGPAKTLLSLGTRGGPGEEKTRGAAERALQVIFLYL
jgi:hypothetical protein